MNLFNFCKTVIHSDNLCMNGCQMLGLESGKINIAVCKIVRRIILE